MITCVIKRLKNNNYIFTRPKAGFLKKKNFTVKLCLPLNYRSMGKNPIGKRLRKKSR